MLDYDRRKSFLKPYGVGYCVKWTERNKGGGRLKIGNSAQTYFLNGPFDQLLIFRNSYQHAKHEPISSISSGDLDDSKILQSNWMGTFWPLPQEQEISQTPDLCTNTGNNTSFHYITNPVKINDQIFH